MSDNTYNYSYSGADCRAFAKFEDVKLSTQQKQAEIDYKNKLRNLRKTIEEEIRGLKKDRADYIESRAAAGKAKYINAIDKELESYKEDLEELIKKTDTFVTALDLTRPIQLESLATISISVHEPKGFARALGYRGIKGVSRSVRTIAGSMIFTVTNGHPLQALLNIDPKVNRPFHFDDSASKRSSGGRAVKSQATELSPFSLELYYKSEYPSVLGGEDIAHAKLLKVEFLNEGMVTSVNDMVSEITYQFVAKDLEVFSQKNMNANVGTLENIKARGRAILKSIDDQFQTTKSNSEEDIERKLDEFDKQAKKAAAVKKAAVKKAAKPAAKSKKPSIQKRDG